MSRVPAAGALSQGQGPLTAKRGAPVGSAGVFLARPLVGSRWTAGQGPLAQKTPTLPQPVAHATTPVAALRLFSL
jgi:hypothetical protein